MLLHSSEPAQHTPSVKPPVTRWEVRFCGKLHYYNRFMGLFLRFIFVCGKLTLSLPCFSVQIKYKIGKNMSSVQQQLEHHHQKVLIESFPLIFVGEFMFQKFSGLIKVVFGSERVQKICEKQQKLCKWFCIAEKWAVESGQFKF